VVKKKESYGAITNSLPYHVQIFKLTEQSIQNRLDTLKARFYRDPKLHYKKNSFYRDEIERNEYLCYHCRKAIIPDRLNVSKNRNVYHLKCAILTDMIPMPELKTQERDTDMDANRKYERILSTL
jgi:hypothetical protein